MSLIDSTTIPVLQQVAAFGHARQGVLAGNIANLNTPGYQARDLDVAAFEEQLKEAIAESRRPQGGSESQRIAGNSTAARGQQAWQRLRETSQSILYHDGTDISLEHQVTEIAKNQLLHSLAISLMNSQFRLLQTAVSERV